MHNYPKKLILRQRSKDLLANALADGGHACLSVSPSTAPESSNLSTAIYLWNTPVLDTSMFTQRKAWQFRTLLDRSDGIKHEIDEVETLEEERNTCGLSAGNCGHQGGGRKTSGHVKILHVRSATRCYSFPPSPISSILAVLLRRVASASPLHDTPFATVQQPQSPLARVAHISQPTRPSFPCWRPSCQWLSVLP